MKIELESTQGMTDLNGVPARIWEGKTDKGIPVVAFITRIAVQKDQDASEFQKELQEHKVPSQTWPLRMIL